MSESSKHQEMESLLADLQLSKEKEFLKQEKAKTSQTTIQSELFEQMSQLDFQSEAVQNVVALYELHTKVVVDEYADEHMKRQISLLFKDSLKRARLSYK